MTINEFMDEYKKMSKKEVRKFLQEHAQVDLPSAVLGRAFEKLYIEKGTTSLEVPLSELIGLHHSYTLGNGGGWCRSDDVCYLGRNYIVRKQKQNGRIISVSVSGYKVGTTTPKCKMISIDLLEDLKDAAESYKALSGALMTSPELDEETRKDAERVRSVYEMKMLELIETATQNL